MLRQLLAQHPGDTNMGSKRNTRNRFPDPLNKMQKGNKKPGANPRVPGLSRAGAACVACMLPKKIKSSCATHLSMSAAIPKDSVRNLPSLSSD